MGLFKRIRRQAQALWPAARAGFDAVDWNAVVYGLIDAGTAGSGSTSYSQTGGLVSVVQSPALAAHFTAASSQYASVVDNASLSFSGAQSFTIAAFVYHDTTAGEQVICAKRSSAANGRSWWLHLDAGTGRYRLGVSTDGTSANEFFVTAAPAAAPAAGQWYFVAARHRAGIDLQISVNAGTPVAAAHLGGIFDSNVPVAWGARNIGAAAGFLNGRLNLGGIWSVALSDAQITQLYRGGIGMPYQDLTAALKTGLVSYYDFDGDFNDDHGANHLTAAGSPTFVTGVM